MYWLVLENFDIFFLLSRLCLISLNFVYGRAWILKTSQFSSLLCFEVTKSWYNRAVNIIMIKLDAFHPIFIDIDIFTTHSSTNKYGLKLSNFISKLAKCENICTWKLPLLQYCNHLYDWKLFYKYLIKLQ